MISVGFCDQLSTFKMVQDVKSSTSSEIIQKYLCMRPNPQLRIKKTTTKKKKKKNKQKKKNNNKKQIAMLQRIQK